MMKLKREPLSRETRASRRGSGGNADHDLFLGGAGRDGNIGAGLAVDLVENLGQADVIGDDAQPSVFIGDVQIGCGFGRRRGVGNVIKMAFGSGLLLVGHQLDDDRLAIGENLVVLRAVEIDDHARGGGMVAVARDPKALQVALIEQLGAQTAGRLGVGKIQDKAIRIGDELTA